jgi:hypothetical protein
VVSVRCAAAPRDVRSCLKNLQTAVPAATLPLWRWL